MSLLDGQITSAVIRAVVTPVENVKFRMQVSRGRSSPTSLTDIVQEMYEKQGLGSLWAGYIYGIARFVPNHLVVSLCKHEAKKVFASVCGEENKTLVSLLSQISASSLGLLVVYPLDVLRTLSVTTPERAVASFGVLYAGYPICVAGVFVYRGTFLLFQKILQSHLDECGQFAKFLWSTASAIAATLITYPLETLRCQQISDPTLSVSDAITTNGILSLWNGAGVRVFQSLTLTLVAVALKIA